MDKFIISQWNKYQHNLENYYKKNIKLDLNVKAVSPLLCEKCKSQNLQYCDVCSIHECGLDAEYRHKSVIDASDEIINNLLDYIINAGEESKDIQLLGYFAEIGAGLGFDLIYLFQDKKGSLWISKVVYGSYDCVIDIPATTKEEWIQIFMDVSLTVVQNLRNLEQEYEYPFRCLYFSDFEYQIISGIRTNGDKKENELYKLILQNNGVDCKYLSTNKEFIFVGIVLTCDDTRECHTDEQERKVIEEKVRNGRFAISGNNLDELMMNLQKTFGRTDYL